MEDVLDLYAEQLDPKRPVVCFWTKAPLQLIGEARQPIPAAPGRLERFDYEYRRNGFVNLFVFVAAHRSWRRVKVTDRRTADDFALCMRANSSMSTSQRPRQAHPRRPRRQPLHPHRCRSLRRISTGRSSAACSGGLSSTTRPSTPAGSTWLRSEIGVLKGQCLDRRTESCDRLVAEIGRLSSPSETEAALESTGCSPPTRPEPKKACLSRSLAQRVIIPVQGN